MNILLVDDHAVVRQGYASLLRVLMPDLQVREAATGEEALSQVQEQVPHLVIMDFGLPGISGLKPPAGYASACHSCGCCSSACTMNCPWCARHWTPVPRAT